MVFLPFNLLLSERRTSRSGSAGGRKPQFRASVLGFNSGSQFWKRARRARSENGPLQSLRASSVAPPPCLLPSRCAGQAATLSTVVFLTPELFASFPGPPTESMALQSLARGIPVRLPLRGNLRPARWNRLGKVWRLPGSAPSTVWDGKGQEPDSSTAS